MSRAKTTYINKYRVKTACKFEKILQKELADEIGMTPQSLNRALSIGKISVNMFVRISDVLNLSTEYLSFKEEDNVSITNEIQNLIDHYEDMLQETDRAIQVSIKHKRDIGCLITKRMAYADNMLPDLRKLLEVAEARTANWLPNK